MFISASSSTGVAREEVVDQTRATRPGPDSAANDAADNASIVSVQQIQDVLWLPRFSMEERCLQHRRQGQFQVAMGETRQAVLVGDDLALFGHLDATVDGPERLGEDRLMGRTAATSDRAATSVEQAKRHVVPASRFVEQALCLVDLPL